MFALRMNHPDPMTRVQRASGLVGWLGSSSANLNMRSI